MTVLAFATMPGTRRKPSGRGVAVLVVVPADEVLVHGSFADGLATIGPVGRGLPVTTPPGAGGGGACGGGVGRASPQVIAVVLNQFALLPGFFRSKVVPSILPEEPTFPR